MENCLDLAIRTEGAVGNVAPTIEQGLVLLRSICRTRWSRGKITPFALSIPWSLDLSDSCLLHNRAGSFFLRLFRPKQSFEQSEIRNNRCPCAKNCIRTRLCRFFFVLQVSSWHRSTPVFVVLPFGYLITVIPPLSICRDSILPPSSSPFVV